MTFIAKYKHLNLIFFIIIIIIIIIIVITRIFYATNNGLETYYLYI